MENKSKNESTGMVGSPLVTAEQAMNDLLMSGDIGNLTTEQQNEYIIKICESLGLNPLTRPFEFITLSGRKTFYAKKDCTEQLRKLHTVSLEITKRETVNGCYVVTAKAKTGAGRTDESIGAVWIGEQKGEALANMLMKAETKAKRRVTLSICGLGILDETEVASVQSVSRETVAPDTGPVTQRVLSEIEKSEPAPMSEQFDIFKDQILCAKSREGLEALTPAFKKAPMVGIEREGLRVIFAKKREMLSETSIGEGA